MNNTMLNKYYNFFASFFSLVKNMIAYFLFLPYGTKLLNTPSLIWLSFGFFATYGMSIVEFASWYTILEFQLPARFKELHGEIIIPFLIALIIWFIDITFLFLDFSSIELDSTQQNSKSRFYQFFGKRIPKQVLHFVLFGAPIRLGILAIAFWFTAPQLAKLMVLDDINQSVVFEEQQRKATFLEDKINELQESIDQKKKKNDQVSLLMAREIGGSNGQGLSGLSGKGPRFFALERQYNTNIEDIEELQYEKNTIKNDFQNLSYANLVQKYKLKPMISEDKDLISKKLINEKQKRLLSVDNIAKVLLGLFFCSIILLKVFQPHSVKIYLNQFLQAAYDDYQNKKFENELLVHNQLNIYAFENIAQSYYKQNFFDAKQKQIEDKLKSIQDVIQKKLEGIAHYEDKKTAQEKELVQLQNERSEIESKLQEEESIVLQKEIRLINQKIEYAQNKVFQSNVEIQEINDLVFHIKAQKKKLEDKLLYQIF